jgi:hypothetical protein
MHSKHANVLGDCSICHHRMPREEQDTYGEPVTMTILRKMQTEPAACSACHADPFNYDRLADRRSIKQSA